MSLGAETESTSFEEIETLFHRWMVLWIRDSLNQTPDSIDLTESPVKHTNTQRDIEEINEDTSDDDIDKMIKLN